MNADLQDRRDHGFFVGLVTGTFVGAGLALWLVPRAASELRLRATDAARELGNRASERYQEVSTRVSETTNDLTKKGQHVRDDVADAVVRGAHEVERIATAAKTDRVTETRRPAAANKHASSTHPL